MLASTARVALALLALAGAFIAMGQYAIWQDQSAAAKLCSSIQPGMSPSQIAAAVATVKGTRFVTYSDDGVLIGLHTCHCRIGIKRGRSQNQGHAICNA